ncbi:fumarylacetoacetate hydrolase family protein [Novosphingobium sp. PASSN1]|uniref:fumarylacetoacetate hydrolase family protein n=1 Tax=Novosphingobium sp. PASSN1 TaxID=2015561 RepID=UPI000BC88538|nr:fumarylacetoacetate hydrolase family protein [Novosphingobium sp. PASSN1]OYU34717.1 MAG: hypothetical protein CFE35_12550 [Novosphingobium sp. PASSN1]
MRFFRYDAGNGAGLAVEFDGKTVALSSLGPNLPSFIDGIIHGGAALREKIAALVASGAGAAVDRASVKLLNPFPSPGKIICIGLNYDEHAKETNLSTTAFPTVFTRFNSTLLDPDAPILRSASSEAYDYEVELVAVIGKPAHYVDLDDALDYVAGYTVANDVSVRDYQFATSQFTIGKNFDATCPLGPDFVTADELPAGGKGLALSTRLNGETVQSDTTDNMIFNVATLVHKLSQVMSLAVGDIILTGTPSGIGHARKPPLYMKHGDVVECTVEGIATLRNPVVDETSI